MSILVEGFTIVVRIAALRERYEGGGDAFVADQPKPGAIQDGELVGLRFDSRLEFQAWAWVLSERGLDDAATIYFATRLGRRPMEPDDIRAAQQVLADTRDVALVYRKQPCRPEWLEIDEGWIFDTEAFVVGVQLRGGTAFGMVLPEDWSVERAVQLSGEPESGDEFVLTFEEFLFDLSAGMREEAM